MPMTGNRPGAGVPGIASDARVRLFTVHNLANDCQVDFGTFHSMHLPGHWWSMDGGEYLRPVSMLKGRAGVQ